MASLIPFGYASPDAYEHIARLMEDPDTVLVDIRLVPISRWHYQWNRQSLARMYDRRYIYLGDLLGNTNYKPENRHLGIALAHPEEGITELLSILSQHSVILLCACKQYETCHRKTVVDLVQAYVPDVEIVQPETRKDGLTHDHHS